MRNIRYLVTSTVALGALVLSAAPAAAQNDYPPLDPQLTADPATVTVGEIVTFTGTGFAPNEEVILTAEVEPFGAGVAGATEATVVFASRVAPAAQPPDGPPGDGDWDGPPGDGDWDGPPGDGGWSGDADWQGGDRSGFGDTPATFPVTTTADEDGNFTVDVRMTTIGRITVTATGTTSGVSASTVVTVLKHAHKDKDKDKDDDKDQKDKKDKDDGTAKDTGVSTDTHVPASTQTLPLTGGSGTLWQVGGASLLAGLLLVAAGLLWRQRTRTRA